MINIDVNLVTVLGLSQPVAVLLNEEPDTIARASQAGYKTYTDVASFQRYIRVDILGEVVI